MIFIILILVLAGGIVWKINDDWSFGADMLIGLSSMFVGVALILILVLNLAAQGELKDLTETKTAIDYKISSGLNKDSFNLLDKDVTNEIKDYNIEISNGKAYQHDFWVGIFVPNIYDDLKPIDYSEIKQ